MVAEEKKLKVKCYHCGDICRGNEIRLDTKHFCCHGCKIVYELLQENQMCNYYDLEQTPGNKANDSNEYAFLEEESISNSILNFKEGDISGVTFYIPSIHCTSCIWLLENLQKLHAGIIQTQIQFQKKKLDIQFNSKITLRKLVELLASIGYAPLITLNGKEVNNQTANKSLYYKLGIAGFCFGNIMMLSMPEYLSVFDPFNGDIKVLFTFLSLLLALPVFLYSASDYFSSAYRAIKTRVVNIDLPIALGLTAAFTQSAYEIISSTGLGYLDSLTGLIFFLLIGKWYQAKTYAALSFDRDYKSYFPLAACRIKDGAQSYVALQDLKPGDELLIRNEEIIPADGIVVEGRASIDYSFVTGESRPITKAVGELIFAGGKQKGTSLKIKLHKPVSESYLTQLWNKDSSKPIFSGLEEFTNTFGKYFTVAVLLISLCTYLYWFGKDQSTAIYAAVSVLIIFCPCTLALAIPFCFGRAMNILGKNGLYIKNTQTIEKLANNDTIVFDKTGTLTVAGATKIDDDTVLTESEKIFIKSITAHSTHPLSKAIYDFYKDFSTCALSNYREIVSKGIEAEIDGKRIKIGSAEYIGLAKTSDHKHTSVHIQIDGEYKGCYRFTNIYKPNMDKVLGKLNKNFELHLLSGDNDAEKGYLAQYFNTERMHFSQTPHDKLNYVKALNHRHKVMMIGDGLNDAGALRHSYCGVSIIEKNGSFSPACDAMLEADSFDRLPNFIRFAKACVNRVYWSIAIFMIYNFTGLYFAAQGSLKPLVAAILMPMSSVSVVIFVSIVAPRLESINKKS